MNEDMTRKYTTAVNDMSVIDYETIIRGNKEIEKANDKLLDAIKKVGRAKELCTKDNLYIQGINMEQTFEDYYRDVKNLTAHLSDLNEKINRAIYKSQTKQQLNVQKNTMTREG